TRCPASSCRSYTLLVLVFYRHAVHRALHSFPTRRSSDLARHAVVAPHAGRGRGGRCGGRRRGDGGGRRGGARYDAVLHLPAAGRSEEHTSELQSRENLVCRLLLEKKKDTTRKKARRCESR